jgi:glycerol-3-phosphate dehydrogenase (NAD(P)+)
VIANSRCNSRYLPGISLPDAIHIESDLTKAIQGISDILLVVPSHVFAATLKMLQGVISLATPDLGIAWGTKGIDAETNQLLHHFVNQEMPGLKSFAVLAGPSFAREVALGLPTAITVAASDLGYADHWIERLHSASFRMYPTSDLIGVQLCGAIKNVLAIASGILDGMKLGANARAALVTRGLAEMTRLGLAMGAQQETFVGLAGLGDLVLTCTDNQSRNRRFGIALGEGLHRQEELSKIGQVVEGIHNVSQVHHLAKQADIEMPICEQVYEILEHGKTPHAAMTTLLSRLPKKSEL